VDTYLKLAAAGVMVVSAGAVLFYATNAMSKDATPESVPSISASSPPPPPPGNGDDSKLYKVAYQATPELKFAFWFIKIYESQAEADKRVEAELEKHFAKFLGHRAGEQDNTPDGHEHHQDCIDEMPFIGCEWVANTIFCNVC
jgi:hypothetical protein